MIIGTVVVDLHLPGVDSLKEKRRIIKSLMARIMNKYNISIAEIGLNDSHRSSQIGAAVVGNENKFVDQVLAKVVSNIENNPDVNLIDYRIEIL
ncbi:MAG: DUF503 domain-containing protein [Candidatus Zixiibacteriota bacterium]